MEEILIVPHLQIGKIRLDMKKQTLTSFSTKVLCGCMQTTRFIITMKIVLVKEMMKLRKYPF